VYTGTHDNDTTRGWYESLTEHERAFIHRYTWIPEGEPAWLMIRTAWASVANLAVVPLQDVLSLGREARMNVPGTFAGNWRWRMDEMLPWRDGLARLRDLTELYERAGTPNGAAS
jgi:4-alpha-glucanotransferase